MKFYVTRKIPAAALTVLSPHGDLKVWEHDEVIPRAVLLQEVQDADALLCLVTERISLPLNAGMAARGGSIMEHDRTGVTPPQDNRILSRGNLFPCVCSGQYGQLDHGRCSFCAHQ